MEEIPLDDIEPIGGAGPIRAEFVTATNTKKEAGEDNDEETRDPEHMSGDIGIQESDEERKDRHRLISGQALSEYKGYKKILADPTWRTVEYSRAPGISCSELPIHFLDTAKQEDPVYTIMASGLITGKYANDLARAHMDCNKISRLAWDKELSDIGLLETIHRDDARNISLTVQYAEHTPSIPGVAKREFVYFQWAYGAPTTKNKRDKSWILIARHTDHPRRPVHPTPVRALSLSVMLLEPLEPDRTSGLLESPRTNVTIMAWVQPGGWISDKIATLYKTKLADRIKFLRDTNFLT